MRIWLLVLGASLVVCACAPSLRQEDVATVRHVQGDLASRWAAASGGDQLVLKTDYCELEAVLKAANKADSAAPSGSAPSCGSAGP